MADGNSEAKRLLAATIMWLLVAAINGALLGVLLLDRHGDSVWTMRVGLAGAALVINLAVAARFARRRQQVLKAGQNADRA